MPKYEFNLSDEIQQELQELYTDDTFFEKEDLKIDIIKFKEKIIGLKSELKPSNHYYRPWMEEKFFKQHCEDVLYEVKELLSFLDYGVKYDLKLYFYNS